MARTIHISSRVQAKNVNDYRANREHFPEDDISTRYAPGQGPSALDKASQALLLTELVRGMWVVLESFFRPPYTLMYPFEKGALSPRFRGEHALRRYPSGKQTWLFSFFSRRRSTRRAISATHKVFAHFAMHNPQSGHQDTHGVSIDIQQEPNAEHG